MAQPGPTVGIDVGKIDCHAAILQPGADLSTTASARAAAVQFVAPRHELAARVIEHLDGGPPAIIAIELTGGLALPILEALEATPHHLMIAQHTDSNALRTLLRLRKKTDTLDALLIARLAGLLTDPTTAGLVGTHLTPWPQMRAAVQGRAKARHYQKLVRDRTRESLRAQSAHYAEAQAYHTAQVQRLDQAIGDVLRDMLATASPAAHLLATIPLVTLRRACILDAAIGDVSRFATADQLVAYCKVAPGHRPQSGQSQARTRTPRGLTMLTVELHTFSLAVANPRTGIAARFRATYQRVKERSGGRAALWAVKRQLIRVCWGILTSGRPYEGERQCSTIPSTTDPTPDPATSSER